MITIAGENFDGFEGFILEFNSVFVSQLGGEWNGNLDAFNDYLSWPEQPYTILWRKAWKSRRDLGYDATIKWLLRKIIDSDRPSQSCWWDQVDAARRATGPTLFDCLTEAMHENAPLASLVLDEKTSPDDGSPR